MAKFHQLRLFEQPCNNIIVSLGTCKSISPPLLGRLQSRGPPLDPDLQLLAGLLLPPVLALGDALDPVLDGGDHVTRLEQGAVVPDVGDRLWGRPEGGFRLATSLLMFYRGNTWVKLFIGSKVQCLFCFDICTTEGRKGGE